MDEDRFPNAELDFVHRIHEEHEVQTKAKLRQFARKCVLKKEVGVTREPVRDCLAID
jgi:hypothetical protein